MIATRQSTAMQKIEAFAEHGSRRILTLRLASWQTTSRPDSTLTFWLLSSQSDHDRSKNTSTCVHELSAMLAADRSTWSETAAEKPLPSLRDSNTRQVALCRLKQCQTRPSVSSFAATNPKPRKPLKASFVDPLRSCSRIGPTSSLPECPSLTLPTSSHGHRQTSSDLPNFDAYLTVVGDEVLAYHPWLVSITQVE